MDIFKNPVTGSMSGPLSVLIGFMFIALVLSTGLKEAPGHSQGQSQE